MPPVVVRRARVGDADALHRLSLDAIASSAVGHYDDRQRAAWAARRTREGHRWLVTATTTFVAVDGEDVAGFASVALHRVGVLQEGEVDQLFVDPRHGGRGVARLLLDAVARAAVAAGLRELVTHASWRAVPVFERAGFRQVAEETVDLDGVVLTRALMRRALGEARTDPLTSSG
ncbi:GNAT family N-acetyltransferase [Modestobacter sp. I12A-02662]|uniref:GNAT family N-acetyltransferase n=1 Tax=Modestobacter sp. I12A-02662 TaxID=1730496 RepID=UPI0034DFE897